MQSHLTSLTRVIQVMILLLPLLDGPALIALRRAATVQCPPGLRSTGSDLQVFLSDLHLEQFPYLQALETGALTMPTVTLALGILL